MRYRFEFKPGFTLFCLLLLAALISLGRWQLDRAVYKADLLEQVQSKETLPVTRINSLPAGSALEAYTRVEAAGRFVPGHELFLDNRTHQGRAGYHVYSPLEFDDRDSWLWVNRGWVPWGVSRDLLPDIETPDRPVTIRGRAYIPEENPMVRQIESEMQQWPMRIQAMDRDEIEARSGHTSWPFYLLLDADQPHGFVRAWQPVVVRPEKHQAYALQWFLMAGFLVVLYIAFSMRKLEGRG